MNISSDKWRGFLAHLGPYIIVITMLAIINWMTSSYPWAIWPALGWGAGLAFHFWDTLMSGKDQEETLEQQIAEKKEVIETQINQQQIETTRVTSQTIQTHLDKAHAYRHQIDEMVQKAMDSNSRIRLQDLARQVNDWIEAIELLGKRVDRFQQNKIIHQDLVSVPQAIEDLEARVKLETDEATREELVRVLANRKNQLASLKKLQNSMKRAELQIENTLSSLGTIYSQILTGQSTDHVSDYRRLASNVDEEVRVLQDHLEALEEVKLGQN